MTSSLINLSAQQLRKAASIQEKIEELQKQIESILGAAPVTPKAASLAKAPAKPKRKLSAAARAAMSKRLKARWAKRKAAGKKAL
jgi:3-methyladenine DNA glycosylase Tag